MNHQSPHRSPSPTQLCWLLILEWLMKFWQILLQLCCALLLSIALYLQSRDSFQHFVLHSLAVPCEAICNELKTLASSLFCNGAIWGALYTRAWRVGIIVINNLSLVENGETDRPTLLYTRTGGPLRPRNFEWNERFGSEFGLKPYLRYLVIMLYLQSRYPYSNFFIGQSLVRQSAMRFSVQSLA